jgi:hypothetical protein
VTFSEATIRALWHNFWVARQLSKAAHVEDFRGNQRMAAEMLGNLDVVLVLVLILSERFEVDATVRRDRLEEWDHVRDISLHVSD